MVNLPLVVIGGSGGKYKVSFREQSLESCTPQHLSSLHSQQLNNVQSGSKKLKNTEICKKKFSSSCVPSFAIWSFYLVLVSQDLTKPRPAQPTWGRQRQSAHGYIAREWLR